MKWKNLFKTYLLIRKSMTKSLNWARSLARIAGASGECAGNIIDPRTEKLVELIQLVRRLEAHPPQMLIRRVQLFFPPIVAPKVCWAKLQVRFCNIIWVSHFSSVCRTRPELLIDRSSFFSVEIFRPNNRNQSFHVFRGASQSFSKNASPLSILLRRNDS